VRLVHKTASRCPHIVYVNGFAGPWQSANEKFEDTSFGIALNVLRRARASLEIRTMTGAGPLSTAARRVERDVKGVHGDVRALINAGVLQKIEAGLIVFPFDAVQVDYMLRAA